MILNTWILGAMVGQISVFFVFTLSVFSAAGILLRWNYDDCSEQQYRLEKKTYLISALMKYTLTIHIFLFVFTVMALDELSSLFKGAMCPVGVLSSNAYGFPLIYLKLIAVFIYASWLFINHMDGKLDNYPLINVKYLFLIVMYPTIALETALLFLFAFKLNPEIITSCCGSVFNEGNTGIPGLMISMPAWLVLLLIFACVTLILARHFIIDDKRQLRTVVGITDVFLWASFFSLSILAVLTFISTYIYEMPTHNCPFCLLKSEYYFIGFPMYAFLFLSTVAGLNRGILEWLKTTVPLSEAVLPLQTKLGKVSILSMVAFLLLGFLPFAIYYLKTGSLI